MNDAEFVPAINKLTKDLRVASQVLDQAEARFLVDAYYQMQASRIRNDNQVRSMMADKAEAAGEAVDPDEKDAQEPVLDAAETGEKPRVRVKAVKVPRNKEPHGVLEWLALQNATLEKQIQVSLDVYTMHDPIGQWMRAIIGIGPVIAAGFLAHLDVTDRPTAGAFWRFAGLDPTVRWEKGQKRPWNAALKTLCWKLGESFVKVSGNEKSLYGALYKSRKELDTKRNEAGDFAAAAADKLARFKIGKDTDAYKAYSVGKLPPAHVHARAKRFAVKMFISHLHHMMYVAKYGTNPPRPFAIEILGHAHYVRPEDAR